MSCDPQKRGLVVGCDRCREYDRFTDHFCIVRGSNLGGTLRTTGLAAALKASDPSCFISWITSTKAGPIVRLSPAVDQVFEIDEVNQREIAASLDFSLVVNLDPENLYRAFALKLRTKQLEGLTQTAFGQLYATPWFMRLVDLRVFPNENRANGQDYQTLIADALGKALGRSLRNIGYCVDRPPRTASSRLRRLIDDIEQADTSRDRKVVVNVGANRRWETKRWPVERFIQLVRDASEAHKKCSFIVTLGPDESNLVADFRKLADLPGVHVAPLDLSLVELASLIGEASCVITADTLAAHFALAYDRPNILIFGATSPTELPPGETSKRFTASRLDCWPCYEKSANECVSLPKLACLAGTSVKSVVEEIGHKIGSVS